MKKVLITGANSYIGTSFEKYAKEHYPKEFQIDTIDMADGSWRKKDFGGYDVVFHVAGIAHADVGKVTDEIKAKYYAVNTDLAIETCRKAKEDGVKQFIFMSSMIVYGKQEHITKETKPHPANFYGDSKWQADKGVRKLASDDFVVTVLRPPMIYGKGSKGNYQLLSKIARKVPIFPDYQNKRSMLYIENLCEFLCQEILQGQGGVFFPQNNEYSSTSDIVREISKIHNHRIIISKLLNPAVEIAKRMPVKRTRDLSCKAFGDSWCDLELSAYNDIVYQKTGVKESIRGTEKPSHKSALIVTSVASMVDQFIMPSIELLIELGYEVDVAANFIKGSTCSDEKIEELIQRLDYRDVDCYQIDFDRKIQNIRSELRAFKQINAVINGLAEPVNKNRHHHMGIHRMYSLIHSHSPIGGVVGRIEARKHRIRSIYTAHGFHFYTGAPLQNWILFYPIEWGLSFITDTLITINKEDYGRARKHLHAKDTVYIPGIGIDVERFRNVEIDREAKRQELGLRDGDVMLLSVGELNENKNHKVVVEALGEIGESKRSSLHYFIAGKDAGQHDALVKLAQERSVKLHLLDFRTDIPELLKVADVFLLPSLREGLNVGLMEAMASGLPCLVSDIRGNRDLITSQENYFKDKTGVKKVVERLLWDDHRKNKFKEKNEENLSLISSDNIRNLMCSIYAKDQDIKRIGCFFQL